MKSNNLIKKWPQKLNRHFFFQRRQMNSQQVHEKVLNISKSSEKYKSRPWRVNTSYLLECCCLVTKLCPALCDSMDCRPPGSSVHGISQARILKWVAISFSREFSQPMDWIYATTKNKIMKTAVKCFFFNSRKYLYSSIYPETSITLVAQW